LFRYENMKVLPRAAPTPDLGVGRRSSRHAGPPAGPRGASADRPRSRAL